ncbi:hypothetical protein V6N13_028209 [Hibiscus sabdariffa]|uniref:Uncharacterized protein n=1 Tax=Hibiscus sabdariffa TaxID=183260 RepID=A0ABR2DBZ0_9ROSI
MKLGLHVLTRMVERDKGGNKCVNLKDILNDCVKAIVYNQSDADNKIKNTIIHSSPKSDGMQRMVYYFANALESWDTINCLDLNVRHDEVVVISSMYMLANLLYGSVVANGPRKRVLNLIKEVSPNVFILSMTEGAYYNPSFIQRSKDALLHYGALFNMLETIVPCKNPEREVIERDVFGCEIINVIACEDIERTERLKRYKEWHKTNTVSSSCLVIKRS